MLNQNGLYILLAAGYSRRFGNPKLLQPLPNGKSIISASIEALQSSSINFVVVIRQDDKALLEHIETLTSNIAKVRNAEHGLSSVIAEGISALDTNQIDWIGVCLGDMPYISPQTLASLSVQISPKKIVRPQYLGKPGHPVLFGKEFFPTLLELEGDDGAKSVLKSNLDKLHIIDVDDPMILKDIDVPEDVI